MIRRSTAKVSRQKTFLIDGAVSRGGTWSIERIERELSAQIKTIDYALAEDRGRARAVPLFALIELSQIKTDRRVKNHRLAFSIVVRAHDGYTVGFSMGELDPTIGGRDAYIALDRDGLPISGDDGPVRLIVPGDKKPARWLHGIATITLVDHFSVTK